MKVAEIIAFLTDLGPDNEITISHSKQVTLADLKEANDLPEYMSRKDGALEDRRLVELQPNGGYVMRDPVTNKAYNISTGIRI